ncbi:SET domain-containing protein [Setomelanomma holmii]|uniref:SET domain-containing protein n=1 Tax=Setomelanomma holmii TaxID=210430 RepID=A0A9P4HFP0_9PLEO|nr:SET domain-containing protein [Setomelanomma holmii]
MCAHTSPPNQQCAHAQQHVLSDHTPLCHDATPDTQSSAFTHPTWSHRPFCISNKPNIQYCTYTTSTSRTNHGLSIISTPTAADAISSAFPHAASARHVPAKRLDVRLIPGKGYGLVATQPIPRGATILLDSPRIIAAARFPTHVQRAEGAELFAQALKRLPAADRELVFALDKSLGGTEIEDIMKTNAFACQLDDGGVEDAYMCLFPSVARINHACRPNAHARFIPRSLVMEVKALRNIEAGEEIGISYGRVDLKYAERKKLYEEGWNFTCTCDMCMAQEYVRKGSDQRRARFAKLRKKLEGLTAETYDAQQIVVWEKEVMELSAKEGLDVLLAEDYERLAYVYAGHGMVNDARMWAEKARGSLWEWTAVDGGPNNEMVRVEELLRELKG